MMFNMDECLEKIKKNWKEIYNVPEKLMGYKPFLVQAAEINGTIIHALDKIWMNDDDIILAASKTYLYALYYATEKVKTNRNAVLNAVRNNWLSLKFALSFNDDEEIALETIKSNFFGFNLISDKLKNNKKFVLKAIQCNALIYNFLSENLKKDADIVKIVKELINISYYALNTDRQMADKILKELED